MSDILRGIVVVSLEQAVAAPFLSQRLAEAGARVIKVEREGGDFARGYDQVAKGLSSIFVWLNRGKESLVLDFKAPEDKALLERIVARADVFIQNLAPGAAARAGFGSEALRARHPSLITCDVSGYGEEGPYREMRAYDLLVQAESGLASITGSAAEPGRVGASVCDIGTGLNALSGILLALYRRERTGQGAGVAVSMFDAMTDWMAYPLMFHDYARITLPRTGLTHPVMCPYGAYGVKGGGHLLIAVQNDREWRRFAAHVLGNAALADDPRFATNPARVEHRAEVEREIDAVFSTLERGEVEALLREQQIAYGAINTVADVSGHPHLRRVEVATAEGPVATVASPVRIAGAPPEAGPVPTLGQHTAALRAEFAE